MSRKRVHLTIRGRVQGVFFRASVRREAAARGVCGWVRNDPDGSVEAVLEGEGADVETLVQYCRAGPTGARVDRVDLHDEPAGETFERFEIRLR